MAGLPLREERALESQDNCSAPKPPVTRLTNAAGCDEQTPERALALSKAHLQSLREALRRVPDPRAGNRSWPISVLLTTVCLGLLSGRRSLAAIHRYGQQLTRQQRG